MKKNINNNNYQNNDNNPNDDDESNLFAQNINKVPNNKHHRTKSLIIFSQLSFFITLASAESIVELFLI